MSRISKNDWLEIGLLTLSTEGVQGLTIDALTRKLSVTKGSFYHHFKNYEAYKNGLLEFWNEQYTERIVAFSENYQDESQIFSRFVSIISSESPAVEIAIRAWAFQDEQVQAYVQQTDQLRIAFAQQWFQKTLLDAEKAKTHAVLLNAVLIGCYSHFPAVHGDDLQKLLSDFFLLMDIRI
ncbi:MAG: TetR/AcrR family transcriptional regulator [Anaerolineaceae bacterium]|nr:TetR/AcrR family transcriptional regulator [Anaerolineaceae bacterium]